MVADGLEVAIVGRLLLRPVDRALGAVDIEDQTLGERLGCLVADQVRIEASESVIVPLLGEDLGLEPVERRGERALVSRRSREDSIRNVGCSASRSASLVSSYPARRL